MGEDAGKELRVEAGEQFFIGTFEASPARRRTVRLALADEASRLLQICRTTSKRPAGARLPWRHRIARSSDLGNYVR
eukprot:scaffold895_cov315-Pinguiococcus_pyrenoidosus.AAC.50